MCDIYPLIWTSLLTFETSHLSQKNIIFSKTIGVVRKQVIYLRPAINPASNDMHFIAPNVKLRKLDISIFHVFHFFGFVSIFLLFYCIYHKIHIEPVMMSWKVKQLRKNSGHYKGICNRCKTIMDGLYIYCLCLEQYYN